jgi:hypothetical protein
MGAAKLARLEAALHGSLHKVSMATYYATV